MRAAFLSASLRAAVLRRLRSKNGRARPVREKINPHFFSAKGASRNASLILFLTFLIAGVNGFAGEMVERIDGQIVRVDPEQRTLVIQFEHPVTEEKIEKEFFVQESAGFKEFKKLSDLKKDDLVSIDYHEDGSKANAEYVIRVPLKKAYVTSKELAGALTHLKPREK